MPNKIQEFRDEFLKIQECKDLKIKNKKLSVLMTKMECHYDIPPIKNEFYNKAYPVVMALYTDVNNARVFEWNLVQQNSKRINVIGDY